MWPARNWFGIVFRCSAHYILWLSQRVLAVTGPLQFGSIVSVRTRSGKSEFEGIPVARGEMTASACSAAGT